VAVLRHGSGESTSNSSARKRPELVLAGSGIAALRGRFNFIYDKLILFTCWPLWIIVAISSTVALHDIKNIAIFGIGFFVLSLIFYY
jgi:hypothetical protein